MTKTRLAVFSLCLIAVLALATPVTVLATEGPQGGSNSTKGAPPPPPPPPPGAGGMLGGLIAFLFI